MSVNRHNYSDHELVETTISSDTVLQGGMMLVKRDQVLLPSGNQGQREYVIHPGALVVIPMLSDGNFLFERQFRYPLKNVFIEFPAGKIDLDEDILHAGQRELLEETGYTAQSWTYLGLQHPCIGYSDEVIHMYLAQDLTLGEPKRDEDEALQLFEMTMTQGLVAIASGEITDAKTIVALVWAEKYLQGLWKPSINESA